MTVSIREEEISFDVADGLRLHGTLSIPDGPVRGVAVIVAGSGPTDRNGNSTVAGVAGAAHLGNVNLYRDVAQFCAREGVAVLRYDKRGVGMDKAAMKNPDPDCFAFDKYIDDARHAVRAVTQKPGLKDKPLTLIGHSEGGMIALALANETRAADLVLMATPGRTLRTVMREQVARNAGMQMDANAAAAFMARFDDALAAAVTDAPFAADMPASLRGLFNEASRSYMKQALDFDPLSYARKIRARVLVLNGTHDAQVHHRRDADALYDALRNRRPGPGQQVLVKPQQASHMFKRTTNPYDMKQAFTGPLAERLFTALRDFFATAHPGPATGRKMQKTPCRKPRP